MPVVTTLGEKRNIFLRFIVRNVKVSFLELVVLCLRYVCVFIVSKDQCQLHRVKAHVLHFYNERDLFMLVRFTSLSVYLRVIYYI